MDQLVQCQGMLEEDMHAQEEIPHEELDASKFEDTSLLFTKDDVLGGEHSPDEDVMYQENSFQTCSQLKRVP